MTSTPSTFSSFNKIFKHAAYVSGDAEASMSTGLWTFAAGGRLAINAFSVDSLNWADAGRYFE